MFLSRWLDSVALSALLFAAVPAVAQVDTALARQVYGEVNARLGEFRRIAFTARRPKVAFTSEVRAWFEAGEVRKLEVVEIGRASCRERV